MRGRLLASGAVVTGTFAVVALAAIPVAGQTQSPAAAKPPARTATKAWTAPKTPWGHPDIEGTWTSDGVIGIPLARPDQFAGRVELTDEEFAAKVKRDAQTRERAENAVGSFRNDNAWLVKSFKQTSLIVDGDGKIPPLTPAAEKRRATRDRGTFGEGPFEKPEDFTNYDRCITRGIVGSVLPVVYGNGNRIIQTPNEVAISYEMVHDTRVIPLDGRPHLGQSIRQYMGDSRGHWEGRTLVIETTNFLGNRTGVGLNGGGTPTSDALKLTERYTRTGPNAIDYEVTIDDPKTYTAPWQVAFPITQEPGYQNFEYACHEGNYAMFDSLSAARAEEKAADEAAKKK